MGRNIIGMYPDLEVAERVVNDLLANGIERDHISIISHHATERYRDLSTMSDDQRKSNAATGAGAGAAGGAVGGVLVSLGLAALPGVGWILAAGPVGSLVATGLIGAGVGAVAGGIGGALSKAGVPVDHADRYAEGIRRGGALVAAEVPGHRAQEIATVMERHDPLDMDRSAKRWRDREGWERHDPKAKPFDETAVAKEREHWSGERRRTDRVGEETRIPIVEEQVDVGKRDVVRGGARVHTHVVETPVEQDIRLREERVDVERRPADRPAGQTELKDAFREQQDLEFMEHGEEPVVNKTARVTEEVVVGKQTHDRTEHISETERRSEVEIERLAGRSMERLDTNLREHARTRFHGRRYEEIHPAYQLGAMLAHSQDGAPDFSSVDPIARERWEKTGYSTSYDEVREAVRYGYDEALSTRV